MGQRRRRRRRPARRRATKPPKKRLLVLCEGSVTEPRYIRGYEAHVRNATVEVVIPPDQGVPMTLVRLAADMKREARRRARRERDPFLLYDEVWCVFDRDEHPEFHSACEMARANELHLALSNPCFELWLLLHFRDSPGMQHRHKVQEQLGALIPGYDKDFEFSVLAAGVEDAIARARRLDQDAEAMDEGGRNPTTGVYRLLESIAEP